ncbi:DNA-binding response regulator [Notoacmeibacter ruber]|uniref:DNA-binding response regulator n=1 Tax=Notoacmeibacter ruber TaxID=2670375 RepID=A0A3L7JHE7_9HYPH|nr:DNA-binding response regulator [Notoacmeibacter ruber]RLQ89051.1 DNA-binding response regulator [Notoacmeibacter ruber]
MNTHKPSILIVDDSPETASMLKDAIAFHGFIAEAAHSGLEALKAIGRAVPDMVLMDARMPGMDGFETTEMVRSDARSRHVPVMIMTGANESEHVVRAFASGAVDFIAKPINLDELFARMSVHLGQSHRQRSAQMALDATGRHILSVSTHGMIQWMTRQASELLERSGLPHGENQRLPLTVVEWLTEVPEQPLTLQHNGMALELRIVETSPDQFLIRLLDRSIGSDEERLADTFDLTMREAQVLLWIAHGKSNKEIGDILEMSHRTVNKHLEQIFAKLGVENRTAAATTAVRVLWADS